MKTLSILIIKLWPRFKFFKSKSNFKIKVTRSQIIVPMEKVLSQDIHMWNMKALPIIVYGL